MHPSATARIARQAQVPVLVVPVEPVPVGSESTIETGTRHGPSPFAQIIVPLHPDHLKNTAAIATARQLALAGNAEVALWTCNLKPAHRQRAQRELDYLRQTMNPVVTQWHDTNSPSVSDALFDFVALAEGAIVCLDTHAPGRLIDTLAPTLTGQMIRWSPRTVVLVGPHCLPPDGAYSEIAGWIDGSLMSEAVAHLVGKWAQAFALPGALLQVDVPLGVGPDVPSAVSGYVDRLAARTSYRWGTTVLGETINDDRIAHTIVHWAKQHPEALLVMASHGIGLSDHLPGGVILEVARHAPTPIVVIPAHSAAAPN